MTNIGAIKVVEKKDDAAKENLIFVTEGMGSDRITKYDNFQKLFRVDDYLLMGTGDGNLIQATAMELAQMKFPHVKSLADSVLSVTGKFGLTEKDYLGFIIGGKDEDGLFIYHINTTGNFKNRGFIFKWSKNIEAVDLDCSLVYSVVDQINPWFLCRKRRADPPFFPTF